MIVDRPWGRIVTYALNQPSSVKVITVLPGHATVAHAHRLRDELWVVLDEGIVVRIGDRVIEAGPGEEVMVRPSRRTGSRTEERLRGGSWTSPSGT